MIEAQSEFVAADDGQRIPLYVYTSGETSRGVIQILHGLGEYAERYARFAEAAVARGFVVAVHDHRGHGKHTAELGYFAPHDGWRLLTEDVLTINKLLRERFQDQKLTLLGHSMGSYVAQNFAMYYGSRIDSLLLSASTWPSRLQTVPGHLLARALCFFQGERSQSALLHKLGFGDFNRRFKPARTELDWLSRDEDEVDRYIADELCGGPYSNGLWRDLTRGLIGIGSNDAVNRVPADLPIMISGGSDDPVGGDRGLGELALRYAQTGHGRLKVKIYTGGRHEMLNETNRDEVMKDWLDWVELNS